MNYEAELFGSDAQSGRARAVLSFPSEAVTILRRRKLASHQSRPMKKCSYCGKENNDDAHQCGDCGTSFPSTNSSETGGPYEFTEDQNRIIGSVGSTMRMVGIVLLVLGGLQIVAGFLGIINGGDARLTAVLPQGILGLVIGSFTKSAGTAFSRIVSTKGNDIGHLMNALGALRSLYRLQVILLVLAAGVILIVAALVLVVK